MSESSDFVRENFAKGDDIRDAGLTTPENVKRYDNIRYGNDDDCQLLDVYRPKDKEGEKLPVIFSIHGGGWCYGDKDRYQFYCMNLVQYGFAVVNFTYRLAPENKWPCPQEDTNLVAQFIMDNAEEYGFDTDHIFAVGDSAGANALGLYAAICTDPDYAAIYPFEVPEGFKLSAIALNCGPYWFDKAKGMDDLTMNLMDDYLPNGAVVEDLEKICVPTHITDNYVPTLFMTCTGDFLKNQAPLLYDALMEHNIPCEFRFYANKEDRSQDLGHVFHLDVKSELANECNANECAFFKEYI